MWRVFHRGWGLPRGLAVLLLVALGCGSSPVQAEWHSAQRAMMGTRVSVELWHEDAEQAQQAISAVMDAMQAVDAAMSPYIATSDVYRLNTLAARQPVVVSAPVFAVIDKALYYSALSEGAFDISFSSVGRFYDYRQQQSPDSAQINAHLPAINYQLITLNKTTGSVQFLHPDLKIDLGGIAKGYAVDQAIEALRSAGIESAIVSAGGDSRILGDRRGTPWVIGIQHPRKQQDYAVRIPLENSAISTSGDYERFFIRDGQRLHHILNPATGQSANQLQSASIVAPLAVDSDALSTTVFVLGINEGLKLVNRLPGIEAIIIDAAGKLHYSQGLLRAGP